MQADHFLVNTLYQSMPGWKKERKKERKREGSKTRKNYQRL